ncbi:uncharacterized protein LOC116424468 [Nomia melanderi]|uniref:uncharacterized protein LOC116424468 n=1 Tax=Nomia melanderi TaxID=2448451 RepID=UPI0013043DC3|nr:uncharacterized protein LOC116424468 [Nomia melanderi]
MSNETAKRPVTFKTPGQSKVWKVVEAVVKGQQEPTKFTIRELPEDRYEDAIDHMCTYFIAEEPICKYWNGKDDPEYVQSFRALWAEVVKQGLTVAAFVDDPKGGKPILAGVNMLLLSQKGEKENLDGILKSERSRLLVWSMEVLIKAGNVYDVYGTDKYINALGLSVQPSYQGAALGAHLLNARENIGREYGISATATVFTSPIAQRLAARCGYTDLVVKDFEDLVDVKGNKLCPGIGLKQLKLMGKKLY